MYILQTCREESGSNDHDEGTAADQATKMESNEDVTSASVQLEREQLDPHNGMKMAEDTEILQVLFVPRESSIFSHVSYIVCM